MSDSTVRTRNRRGITLLLSMLVVLPGTLCAQISTPTTGRGEELDSAAVRQSNVRVSAALGGTLGSVTGALGGGVLGAVMASCSQRDDFMCGASEVVLLGTLGSVVGSAVGAKLGVRLAGGEPAPTSGNAVLLGLVAGVGTSLLASTLDGGEGIAVLIGFSLGQGVVNGLFASR